jgi:hypothetical protein
MQGIDKYAAKNKAARNIDKLTKIKPAAGI